MKVCNVCGNQCNDTDEFCFICGSRFTAQPQPAVKPMKFCMSCGKELIPGSSFCMGCGTPVGSTGPKQNSGHARRQVKIRNTQNAPIQPQPMNLPTGSQPQNVPIQPQPMNVPSAPQPQNVPIQSQPQNVPAQPGASSVPAPAAGSNSSIYIVEFMGALFKAHNIPVIIYMLMNVVFITAFCFLLFPDVRFAIPIGLAVYLLSLIIALSPIGEKILRFQTKCSPLTDQAVMQRIMPIFEEAKRRATITANAEGRTIPDDVQLFYNDDSGMNAFATGRKTVCFTKGILSADDEMLLATFEHEFGHIAHHDTDSILLITVGNLIFSGIITFFRIGIFLSEIMFHIIGIFLGGDEGIFMILMGSLSRFLSLIFVDLFMLIWTGFGNLLVLKSSRSREFLADEFAFRCGKGRELQAMLAFLEGGHFAKTTGLFATLKSSHPDTVDRIAALQKLEATSVPVVH